MKSYQRFGLKRRGTGRTYKPLPITQVESPRNQSNVKRVYGLARRFYGQVNLKDDTSLYLNPIRPNWPNTENELSKSKFEKSFLESLSDLARTKKRCIVYLTIEYFDKSEDIETYVDCLISMCLTNDFMIEVITKNFLLITNLVRFGESIKRTMFNCLIHIHNDLHTGYQSVADSQQLYCKFYNPEIALSFFKLVNILFFRFRKHLDCFRRYKVLAPIVLCSLNYFLDEGSLDSIILFTRFAQLNFHALEVWYYNPIIKLVDKVHDTRDVFKEGEKEWHFLSGALDIIYKGPIFGKRAYDHYTSLLGEEWTENIVHPPVQVLNLVHDVVKEEKLDHFHINDDDVFRNMFVYLP